MARFSIVKFPSENSVTVVSSDWVRDEGGSKICAWPPYRCITRLNKAVKKHETPKPSWQWFGVDVMKQTDTYDKGLELEEEAMYRSDLNTENESTQAQKRKKSHKRKKTISEKNQYSSDEALNESNLPPFPSLKKAGTQKTTMNITSLLREAEYLPQNNEPTTSHSSRQFTFQTPELSSPINPNPLQNMSFHSSPVPNNFTANVTPVRSKEENFQKKVIRMLESLRSDVKDIMDAIKIKNCHPLPQLPPGCPKLPCENPEDLGELENILKDEVIFTSICNYLSTIGGSSVKDSTRRVLQHLMSNTLSLNYNWKGTRGVKLGFGTFTFVTKLILGAVRNNPSSASATEVEVNNIIKTWLMHAKDRDGGRNARAVISNACG